MSEHKPRVLSGVQPTGNLHLGNYLGAIRNFVALQESHECLYCVVDLHAITVFQDPAELAANTREVAAAFIAAGVDPKNHIVFNQAQVPQHAELAWVLNCVARMGWLNRMTQFKEKAGKDREKASVGLYVYPNLMAADILLYQATHVPVGEDQKQHLELARDIAQKFNHDFNAEGFFPQPDSGDEIAKKIRKAKTDPDALPDNEAALDGRPEAANLLGIYAALAEQTLGDAVGQFAGQQFSALKEALAELAIAKIGPIGDEMRRLKADPGAVDAILAEGAERARALAEPVMADVRKLVGFLGS
jgi:tryptophanyl-tRNA synthetase